MSTDSSPRQDARLSARIRDFFYREEVPYSLALVRILMPLVLLSVMIPRWFDARELYSADGAPCPLGFVYGWPNLLPTFSGEIVVLMHSVLIFTLIASLLGWFTRLSLVISTVLYVYLNMQDSVSTMTKYSVIATHVMLLLSFSQCGSVWSMDAWLARRRGTEIPLANRKSAVWPKRLMQLMIGIVYLGAAITKMHTPEFFSGDQMKYWMLSHVNFSNPGGEVLSQYPSLVVASAYLVIVWEILFVFLAWKGLGRISMIALGVVFHVMTAVTLGLYIFPLVCSTIYFAFLGEEDIHRLAGKFRSLRERWNLPRPKAVLVSEAPRETSPSSRLAWASYAAAVTFAAVAGLAAERLMDPYGVRRAEGRFTLKEVPPEIAHQWFQRTEPIHDHDKVFSFNIGSFAVGDSLANQRRVFKQGERLIAEVSLNPPHEDMYLECNLHDAEDRVVMRYPAVVSRQQFRSHFVFEMSASYPPGEYQLVLHTAGKEVSRRVIQLEASGKSQPQTQAVSAN